MRRLIAGWVWFSTAVTAMPSWVIALTGGNLRGGLGRVWTRSGWRGGLRRHRRDRVLAVVEILRNLNAIGARKVSDKAAPRARAARCLPPGVATWTVGMPYR